MALTTQEENILKKRIEIEKKREEWNALSKEYLDKVRGATRAEEQKQSTLRDSMNTKHQERVALEAELSTLLGA